MIADNIVTKPILRLENGQNFDAVPPDLQAEIQKQLGIHAWKKENFTIKLISQKNGEEYIEHQEQFRDRIEAIHEGVVFLLNVFNKASLAKSYFELTENFKEKIRKIQNPNMAYYQNILAEYKKEILEKIQKDLNLKEKEVVYTLGKAEEMALAKKPKPILCTVTKIDADYAVMIDKPENPLSDAIIKDFRAIKSDVLEDPFWFVYLKPIEKDLIKNMLSDIDLDDKEALKRKINAFSSKLRFMPVLSNYGSHTLITKIENKQAVVYDSEMRSGHIGSRDMSEMEETKETNEEIKSELRKVHAVKNLRHQVMSEINKKLIELESSVEMDNKNQITIPILLQSFVTPIVSPDAELDEDKISAVKIIQSELNKRTDKINGVEVKFEIVSTNHPLNIGRIVCHTDSSSEITGKAINRLMDISRENNVSVKNSLEEACKSLDTLAFGDDGYFGFSYRFSDSRELHLASLERIINSDENGISICFCAGGKDRTAVVILYTNAMKMYDEKYGKLYQFEDTENNKDNFGKIFAELYWAKHQQAHAGLNAPGSNGLQNISDYVPAYLQAAIKKYSKIGCDDFDECNRLACNTDIRKISEIKSSLYEEVFTFFNNSSPSSYTDKNEKSFLCTAMKFHR